MACGPAIEPAAALQFVINAAAGSGDAEARRNLIESVLQAESRRGELHFCDPPELPGVAHAAAQQALAMGSAVVAVGGDGTINAVAQAAHAAGCAMGVVPMGTFNYFARTHGIPTEPADALRLMLHAQPVDVQVAGVNERVFLVNASLGLYPELLQDREAFTARFGRSRWVALWAGVNTLLRAQRQLRLRIEQGGTVRKLRTLTLFVGNNRLQLEQLGVQAPHALAGGLVGSPITAVMLRPVGLWAMLGLMLRGALGTLGDARSVEHFEFDHMVVRPSPALGRRGIKVAFDGEVTRMRPPLAFRVLAKPLHLLRPPLPAAGAQAPPTDPGPA